MSWVNDRLVLFLLLYIVSVGLAGAVLPHPDKAETGGEDAFFVSSHGQGAFGVADGVGGWNMEGVDPSRYSRSVSRNSYTAAVINQQSVSLPNMQRTYFK